MVKQHETAASDDDNCGLSPYRHATTKLKLKGDNPLARARSSKRKAEELWHRKIGGGHCMFVQFYTQQAIHLLPNDADDEEPQQQDSMPELTKNSKPPGKGESRASKRRKRKQRSRTDASLSTVVQSSSDGISGQKREPMALVGKSDSQMTADGKRLIEAFHAHQKQQPAATKLNSFLTTLALPLPLSFRIRHTVPRKELEALTKDVEKNFGHLLVLMNLNDDSIIYTAKKTSSGLAAISKGILVEKAPELKAWLLKHSAKVARQEIGSMLPVVLLSRMGFLQAGSRVLDLCASPGSKCLQALEVVGSTGKIKANDINKVRLESLRDAVKRADMKQLESRIKFSNFDASQFPIPCENHRLFDVVLCDVPCSGDGTIRKDAHILPGWTPETANALHSLQCRILVRALQCLKIGGVCCYSTCSLNPCEDEAVVAAALKQVSLLKCQQVSAELVPCPDLLNLKLRPGVSNWGVACSANEDEYEEEEEEEHTSLRWFDSYDDAAKAQMEYAAPSLWPPEEHEAKVLCLERCARLWPQDDDCGGFFVSLIRRTA